MPRRRLVSNRGRRGLECHDSPDLLILIFVAALTGKTIGTELQTAKIPEREIRMSGTISGNVVTASEIVYIKPTGDYTRLSPFTTVSDGSGNYTFGVVADGIYEVYTVNSFASYQTKVGVIVSGDDHLNVNLGS